MRSRFRLFACSLFLCVSLTTQAWAQDAGTGAPAAAPAQAATDIRGIVSDEAGKPVAGARVEAHGAGDAVATTDADGSYDLHVAPGIYRIVVTKRGYDTATQSSINVAGAGIVGDVRLTTATSPDIQEIGRVNTATERSRFNTTPASVQTLTTRDFDDQGRTSLAKMLDEIPGVSTTTATGNYWSGIGLVDSGWVNPQIRGAFSYESAQQFDGFPLLTGDATAGFNAGLMTIAGLGGIDITKGPGADSTTINSAVGGTINYRSIVPTLKPVHYADVGTDGLGGSVWKIRETGTVGRLGYALAYSADNSPGAFGRGGGGYNGLWSQGNYANTWTISYNGKEYLFPGCAVGAHSTAAASGCQSSTAISSNPQYLSYNTPWLMCCKSPLSLNDTFGGLGKLVYHITPQGDDRNLTLDALYSATLSRYHEGAYRGPTFFGGTFTPYPGSGYTGSIPAGSDINVPWFSNGDSFMTKFQNTFETNFRGKIGPGFLHVGFMSLYQYDDWHSPDEGPALSQQIWGTIPLIPITNGLPALIGTPSTTTNPPISAYNQTFNGQTVVFQQRGGYLQSEFLREQDWIADYRVPIGPNSVALSWTQSTIVPDTGNDNSDNGLYAEFGVQEPATHYDALKQTNNELRLTATLHAGSKLTALTSLYYNQYINHLSPLAAPLESTSPTAASTPQGPNWMWTTLAAGVTVANPTAANVQHYLDSFTNNYNYYLAPRQAFAYRLNDNTSLRFSTGGALVPLPILALAGGGTSPSFSSANGWYTVSQAPIGLKPETSWGYDIGADMRIPNAQITISTDAYSTTLRNQFFTHMSYLGTFNDGLGNGSAALYGTQVQNLGHSRYEGAELSVHRDVQKGFGFVASGYLERAYAYDLPADFYNNPETGAPYSQNLGIVANQNFNNGGATGAPSGVIGPAFAAIPYAGGYGELSYHWGKHDNFARFGATYYGNNNTFHAPAFFLLNASVRYGITDHLGLQVSADNLGNIYTSPFTGGYAAQVQPVAGVPVPEANGQNAFGPYLSVGPSVVTLTLQYR